MRGIHLTGYFLLNALAQNGTLRYFTKPRSSSDSVAFRFLMRLGGTTIISCRRVQTSSESEFLLRTTAFTALRSRMQSGRYNTRENFVDSSLSFRT